MNMNKIFALHNLICLEPKLEPVEQMDNSLADLDGITDLLPIHTGI